MLIAYHILLSEQLQHDLVASGGTWKFKRHAQQEFSGECDCKAQEEIQSEVLLLLSSHSSTHKLIVYYLPRIMIELTNELPNRWPLPLSSYCILLMMPQWLLHFMQIGIQMGLEQEKKMKIHFLLKGQILYQKLTNDEKMSK